MRGLTTARPGAKQHEAPNETRLLKCERLRHVATNRESEKVDLCKAERTDESDGVLGHRLDSLGRIAARSCHARVVEQDHGAISAEPVGNDRIPMIETAAEVLHENQWHTTLLSKLSVGEADSFRLHELCRCCYVGVQHLLAFWRGKVGRR